MNDSATNPLSWDWNKVEMQYCDGGSYCGDNDNVFVVSYGGARLRFVPITVAKATLRANLSVEYDKEGVTCLFTIMVDGTYLLP